MIRALNTVALWLGYASLTVTTLGVAMIVAVEWREWRHRRVLARRSESVKRMNARIAEVRREG